MKKVLALLLCIALMTAVFAVSPSALTEEEAYAGYYLVGSMTDWDILLTNRLDPVPEPGNSGQDQSLYLITDVPLTTADSFKVVYSHDGRTIDEWFPAGVNNNCTLSKMDITADSIVDLTFRPNMDGDGSWYYGCIHLEQKSVPPTDAAVTPTVPPTENNGEIGAGYYIVFQNDQCRIRERYRMNRMGANLYWLGNVTMSTAVPFKIAYSEDCQTASAFWPEGENDYYVPRYNTRYMYVEFTPEGNLVGDSSDSAWYDGYVRAWPCEPPQEDATEPVPVTDKEMKVNRYQEAFDLAFPTAHYWCDYEELYYHKNMFDCDDWALVKVISTEPLEGSAYGVFDDLAVFSAESYPFRSGYGVLDFTDYSFHDLTEVWDEGYEDLHDVFLSIAPQYSYTLTLGDADGDFELTILDVTHLQRFLAEMEDLGNDEWVFRHHSCFHGPRMNYLSDYDCDGDRTILDATLIQRHLVGMPRCPHGFTATVRLVQDGDTVAAAASASFGEEPVEYCFTIDGGVHAGTVYGDDWGRFTYYDPDYEYVPGNEHKSTGWIADSSVALPLRALTYDDDYTLTVTARDALGRVTQEAILYFKNVYQ